MKQSKRQELAYLHDNVHKRVKIREDLLSSATQCSLLVPIGQSFSILVLLDLHLPDGEGINLIRQIRQHDPETPVVVLTGNQDDNLAVEAIKEGAQDYVLKSDTFSPTKLSQMGHTDLGNWLVRRIQYAVKRADLAKQFAKQKQMESSRRILSLLQQYA